MIDLLHYKLGKECKSLVIWLSGRIAGFSGFSWVDDDAQRWSANTAMICECVPRYFLCALWHSGQTPRLQDVWLTVPRLFAKSVMEISYFPFSPLFMDASGFFMSLRSVSGISLITEAILSPNALILAQLVGFQKLHWISSIFREMTVPY